METVGAVLAGALAWAILIAVALVPLSFVVRFLRWFWRSTRFAKVPAPPLSRPFALLDRVPELALLGMLWFWWLPFAAIGWGWRWMWKRAKPGDRVLERFDWPKIYRDGERYTVVADYSPPPSEGRARLNALAGAAVIAVIRLATRPDWRLPEVGAGVILWPAFFAAIVVYVLSHFPRRQLRMTIGQDGIGWRNGGWRRCHVLPEDMGELAVEVPRAHSKAADEEDTDRLRRKPSRPVYRIASEVLMHSGYGLRDTQQIAEIRKDRNGLKAKRLQTGVDAALKELAGDLERRTAMRAVESHSLD